MQDTDYRKFSIYFNLLDYKEPGHLFQYIYCINWYTAILCWLVSLHDLRFPIITSNDNKLQHMTRHKCGKDLLDSSRCGLLNRNRTELEASERKSACRMRSSHTVNRNQSVANLDTREIRGLSLSAPQHSSRLFWEAAFRNYARSFNFDISSR